MMPWFYRIGRNIENFTYCREKDTKGVRFAKHRLTPTLTYRDIGILALNKLKKEIERDDEGRNLLFLMYLIL
jgi:hypothetical protein